MSPINGNGHPFSKFESLSLVYTMSEPATTNNSIVAVADTENALPPVEKVEPVRGKPVSGRNWKTEKKKFVIEVSDLLLILANADLMLLRQSVCFEMINSEASPILFLIPLCRISYWHNVIGLVLLQQCLICNQVGKRNNWGESEWSPWRPDKLSSKNRRVKKKRHLELA